GFVGSRITQRRKIAEYFTGVQTAGATLVVVCAALFVGSFWKATTIPPGFEVPGAMYFTIDMQAIGLDNAAARQLHRNLVNRVESLPGVTAVGLTTYVPLGDFPNRSTVLVDGFQPPVGEPGFSIYSGLVSGRYFAAAGTRVEGGRTFMESDASQ